MTDPNRTSVGDVPAPINLADADDWCPHCGAHWPREHGERLEIVKYLRREADTIALRDGVADHLRVMARAIETGDHVK